MTVSCCKVRRLDMPGSSQTEWSNVLEIVIARLVPTGREQRCRGYPEKGYRINEVSSSRWLEGVIVRAGCLLGGPVFYLNPVFSRCHRLQWDPGSTPGLWLESALRLSAAWPRGWRVHTGSWTLRPCLLSDIPVGFWLPGLRADQLCGSGTQGHPVSAPTRHQWFLCATPVWPLHWFQRQHPKGQLGR